MIKTIFPYNGVAYRGLGFDNIKYELHNKDETSWSKYKGTAELMAKFSASQENINKVAIIVKGTKSGRDFGELVVELLKHEDLINKLTAKYKPTVQICGLYDIDMNLRYCIDMEENEIIAPLDIKTDKVYEVYIADTTKQPWEYTKQ